MRFEINERVSLEITGNNIANAMNMIRTAEAISIRQAFPILAGCLSPDHDWIWPKIENWLSKRKDDPFIDYIEPDTVMYCVLVEHIREVEDSWNFDRAEFS